MTVAEAFEEVCECIQARGLTLQASKQVLQTSIQHKGQATGATAAQSSTRQLLQALTMCTELLLQVMVAELIQGATHTHCHVRLPGLHIAALLVVQVHGT